MQLQQQQQQKQQQQQQVKQQLQKQSNEWVQIVRKTNKTDVDLQRSTKSTSTTSKTDKKTESKTKIERRILITRSSSTAARASPLAIRNAVNSALTSNEASRNAAVIAANYNEKDTIILTTREDCNTKVVLKYKQQIYEQLRKVDSVINKPQVQENWTKIIIHYISTEQYNNTTESINELHHEIENMNPSVKLITSPRWLNSLKRREGKSRSSIVIAISDHELAKKIINRGLWIDGRRTKTERFTEVKSTD